MRGTPRPWAVLAALLLLALGLGLAWLASAPAPNPEPPSPVAVAGAERSAASIPQATPTRPDDNPWARLAQATATASAASTPAENATWTPHLIRSADAAWCRRLSQLPDPVSKPSSPPAGGESEPSLDPLLERGLEAAHRSVRKTVQQLLRQQADALAHTLADHMESIDSNAAPATRAEAFARLRAQGETSRDPDILLVAANGCDRDTACRLLVHERIVRLAPQNAAAWIPLLSPVNGEAREVQVLRQLRAFRAIAQTSELRGAATIASDRLRQLIQTNNTAWPCWLGPHEAAAFELAMEVPGSEMSFSLAVTCNDEHARADCGPALETLWRLGPRFVIDRLTLIAAVKERQDLAAQPTWAERIEQVEAVRRHLKRRAGDSPEASYWRAACDPERPLAQRLQAYLTEGEWATLRAEQTAADRQRAP